MSGPNQGLVAVLTCGMRHGNMGRSKTSQHRGLWLAHLCQGPPGGAEEQCSVKHRNKKRVNNN
eukprot:1160890-Pelagomonas_calceolata.AAC.8